jgi:uncharacterized protein with von Willebrand factor type A (vWA) domain
MTDAQPSRRQVPAPASPVVVDRAPTILVAPTGEAIDGRRLLAEAVGFGRALRSAGLAIDLGAAIDFARALALVDVGNRGIVRDAGAAVFVRRRDEREVYDRVFDLFWRRRGRKLAKPRIDPNAIPDADREEGEEGASDEPGEGREATMTELAQLGIQVAVDADEDGEIEGETISPDAYSRGEVLRHRDFDRMTAAELRDAERFVDLLRPLLERRRTRRHELHPHGRRLAPRAMFRRNLATGELTEWVWRRRIREPRQLVVLCDISGSMERHSRLLLRFVQALARTNEVRTESFVFGPRLTRGTRLLPDRDRDRALDKVADAVTDWAGGTRIGESFRDFNHRWARRTLRSSGVVIVVSDGWDRGDPALVAAETARLRRNCHRLVWLNPLASAPGYQPLAAGMKAAYPFIDDFLPAGTLASLERLGQVLAGSSGGTARRGAAVTHATTVAPSLGLFAPEAEAPRPLDGGAVASDRARPLT